MTDSLSTYAVDGDVNAGVDPGAVRSDLWG